MQLIVSLRLFSFQKCLTYCLGQNEKIQIFEFCYGRLVHCCYGQDKRLGQILC